MTSYPLRAPTWASLGTRCPLRWSATRDSKPPMRVPPIKTAGTEEFLGEGLSSPSLGGGGGGGRAGISWSSSSITVGWTPIEARSFFMTWHMQHDDRLNMMTGCSEIRRWILASVDSATSKERLSGLRWPCIGGGMWWRDLMSTADEPFFFFSFFLPPFFVCVCREEKPFFHFINERKERRRRWCVSVSSWLLTSQCPVLHRFFYGIKELFSLELYFPTFHAHALFLVCCSPYHLSQNILQPQELKCT